MTLEQLRIFVAVAEQEHMTRAAGVLNLTQSATSAAIAALEDRYAIKLFDRIGRSIRLTDAGRQFVIEARAVLARFGINCSDAVHRALADPANETPKPQDPVFDRNAYRLITRPKEAFRAAEAAIRAEGFDCIFLGDRIEGEAREIAAVQAKIARDIHAQGRCGVIVSGGELTVTIRGKGRGGPNQEYALALAQELRATPGIAAVAGDTDGTDGGGGHPDDPAGAFVDDTTLLRAHRLGLDPAAFLAENDSTGFFERLGDLLQPGPTFTNVNDFRAIFVGRN